MPDLPATTTIDAQGNLLLPRALLGENRLTIACPPAWLADGKFQLVDHNTMIAITHRIARMRTSGAMANVAMMEAAYRTHASSCRIDPDSGTVHLPARLRARFAPLPCAVTLTDRDGPVTVSRAN
jgi:hypothetical protein